MWESYQKRSQSIKGKKAKQNNIKISRELKKSNSFHNALEKRLFSDSNVYVHFDEVFTDLLQGCGWL